MEVYGAVWNTVYVPYVHHLKDRDEQSVNDSACLDLAVHTVILSDLRITRGWLHFCAQIYHNLKCFVICSSGFQRCVQNRHVELSYRVLDKFYAK